MAAIHNVLVGSAGRLQRTITISANQTNYVLNTAKVTGYLAGITDVVLTINSGIYVSSNSTAGYALDVDTSWTTGDTVTIVNNGFIVGRGGNGGSGRGGLFQGSSNTWDTSTGGSAPTVGGPALRAQRAVSVNNAGTIGGGGGGGGGGGRGFTVVPYSGTTIRIGGGGGGGRSSTTNSSGGAGGTLTGFDNFGGTYSGSAAAGGSGTSSAAGSGGSTATGAGVHNGGNGGGWGATGVAGTNGNSTNGVAGAAAGAAVAGNSFITWVANGTRLGAIA